MSSKSVQKKLLKKGIEQRSLAAAGAVNGKKKGSSAAANKIEVDLEAAKPLSDEESSGSDDEELDDDDDADDDDDEVMAFDEDDGDEEEEDDDDEDEDELDSDEDEDDDGVTEAGWNRMMELLGDVDPAELGLELDDEEGDEEDEDEDEDEDGVEGEQDDEEEDSEEEEGDSDEDENEIEEQLYEELDEEDDDADIVPVERETIRNEASLERILATFKTPTTFFDTLTLTNPKTAPEVDADNDLERELAFYKQSLWAAQHAEKLFSKASLPFFRPSDYFAEMIKSDAHMASLRQKLLDEQAGMKASEDARKLRDAKKFGKKVQVERLKEREKEKKEVGKRLESLKKRRKGGEGFASTEDFDIALEDAIAGPSKKRKVVESERTRGGRGGKISRRGRDSKFGNPTSSRRPKENNFKLDGDGGERGPRGGRGGRGGGRGGRGGRGGARGGAGGGAKRLGKSRRQ